MRLIALLALILCLLPACVARETPPASGSTAASAPSADPAPSRSKPPPEMSDPLPAERVPAARPPSPPPVAKGGPAVSPATVDRSCRSDADCAVKDVGSCCGAMPACVNRNARTDPAAVQAQCAQDGRASICGSAEISACSCVRGTCTAQQTHIGGLISDPQSPNVAR